MAKTSIIRTAYAQRFLYHLDNTLLFQNLCNTQYEGDPNAGSVIINSMGDLTIGDYAGTATVQSVTSSLVTLSIDQKKYFAQLCDDVDKVQSNLPLAEETAIRGAYGIANAVDSYIASRSFVEGTSAALGTSGSAAIPTGSASTSAYDFVVNMGTALSNANVPAMGRYILLPAFAVANIAKDSRIITQNPVVLANGVVQGMLINGMQVYQSNNLLTFGSGATTEYAVIAGHSPAQAFVGALKEMETFRSPTSFGDVVRGLFVFGYKTVVAAGVQTAVIKGA